MRQPFIMRAWSFLTVLFAVLLTAVFLLGCRPVAGGTGAAAARSPGLTPQAAPTAVVDATAPSASPESTPIRPATPAPPEPDDVADTSTPTPTAILTATASVAVPLYGYRVVDVYPHDRSAFTEGLVFVDGVLYEGTGLDDQSHPPGQSVLEKKDLATGQALQGIKLAPEYFGEGVTVLGDRVYQLTWQERTGFVYDKDTLQQLDTFSISSDGWGLTHDGKQLIRSDGTSTLTFLDPETLQETGSVVVHTAEGNQVDKLNELETIDGEVYANIWTTDVIVRIDPKTGLVLGWIDLTGLLSPEDRVQQVDVLNGIAYDAAGDRLFVTGKWWPKLFEIDLVQIGQVE